jgi:hypothetical protein
MSAWRDAIDSAVSAFLAVADLDGEPIVRPDITVEFRDAPHHPPSNLPARKVAVYGFWYDGTWLEIGMAGSTSGPRCVSHHYNLSAPSALAKSLAADPAMRGRWGSDPLSPGIWIRDNTCRVNTLLPADRAPELLSLLEAFLHLRLRRSTRADAPRVDRRNWLPRHSGGLLVTNHPGPSTGVRR